ncbi:uncharacterized protein LOC112176317 [Rosa chinensis]|uniref:uncharacterized protein LOC112176317 n=1 Tax=Rosa chinensis TaxID=74649 RepID=UPI000D09587F|nr:uncharacterized protein LOC112176317 [Rosa chinensis]
MGKKKSTSTENEGSRKQKATWLDEVVAIFCDIAAKEVAKGNRPETGIGWDPARKTIDAPAEWWESKFQINPEYRKFREVGISPEMMAVYDNMFRGSTALGHFVMIPSATIDIEEVVEDSEHNLISGDDEEDSDQDNERRGKKRTNLEHQTEADKQKKGKGVMGGPKEKAKKVGGAAKLSKQIDRLVDVVGSRSTATSVRDNGTSQRTSIKEVMRVVATLPGAETGTKLWWFATELFCSQEKREMFSIMTDADLKLQFLILNQKKITEN